MENLFSNPQHLYSRAEVLSNPSPVPKVHGIYAWFFKEVPNGVPVEGCLTHEGLSLLYVGSSPDKKSKPDATQTLQQRVRYHFQGNADKSTLRRSLGILLAPESHFPLRRVGSGKKMTLTPQGEQWLNSWMEKNAFVTWVEHEEPWVLENELFQKVALPLNIQGNKHHPFAALLLKKREEAIAIATEAPVAEDSAKR